MPNKYRGKGRPTHKGPGRPAGWTLNQRLFVKEYLKDRNATQAAIRAGYSKKTAWCQGQVLLDKPHVQKAIAQEIEQKTKKLDITAERVLSEMARLAFAQMGGFVRLEGNTAIIDFSETTKDDMAALAEITQDEYVEGRGDDSERVRKTKIKLHDKKGALDTLMKYLKLMDGGADQQDATARATAIRDALREMKEKDGV